MHRRAAGGEAGATEETLEETEYEKAREIIDNGGGEGDDDKQEKGRHVDRVAANGRDLAEWGEEQRAGAVSKDIEGER